jgi:hypothetical protein
VSLRAIIRYDIARSFPADSTTTIPEIVQNSELHVDDVQRIIRHALTQGLFREPRSGVVAHSATTQVIVKVPYASDWLAAALQRMGTVSGHVVDAMQKWPGSQEPTQTAYNMAYDTDLPFFVHLSQDETKFKHFASAMTFFTSTPAMKSDFAIDGYDWAQHASDTIVDVGGSHGVVAFKLAEKYPERKIVVQDRPEVVASAPQKPELGHVEFRAHDFFKEQPIKGADVYFYRWILHDWSDNYCVLILRCLIPAPKKGAKVILMDSIVPEPGTLTPFQEKPIRAFDIMMKGLFNGKERTEGDWMKLVREADDKFDVVEVRKPVGSHLCIIVVDWKG